MTKKDLGLRARIAISLAKTLSKILKMLDLGEGGTLPGRVLLKVYPDALHSLSRALPAILLSGTNAKTTTTALAKAALSTRYDVVTNYTGANMTEGVAAALATRRSGRIGSEVGIFEVDESYLPIVGRTLETSIVALLNLSRDQLDRVSETRMTAAKWRNFLRDSPSIKVVANCDDPLVVFAAETASQILWVEAGLNFRQDAHSCPHCGDEIDFFENGWLCACGFRRPVPDVSVNNDEVTIEDTLVSVRLSLPGSCNVANAAMALGICHLVNLDLSEAANQMALVSEVGGRYRRSDIAGHMCKMLLSKNPAGWLEVFDLIGDDASVVIGINSKVADGRDPSWLWDVPFERLAGKEVFASGERAYDLSVRLHYAGVSHAVIKDPLKAIASCSNPNVSFVGNYTSFQALRAKVGGDHSVLNEILRRVGERVFR